MDDDDTLCYITAHIHNMLGDAATGAIGPTNGVDDGPSPNAGRRDGVVGSFSSVPNIRAAFDDNCAGNTVLAAGATNGDGGNTGVLDELAADGADGSKRGGDVTADARLAKKSRSSYTYINRQVGL